MSWQKYLLLPQLIWHGLHAPRSEAVVWDRYWGAIRKTGEDGDVLWDAGCSAEMRHALHWLVSSGDATLPVIDIGCGNGRRTRMLASYFPRAIGIDVSSRAVARAREETGNAANVAFRALDATAPGVGRQLAAELGDANIYIRGVLHVLDHSRRLSLLHNARQLLGQRGILYYLETNFQGGVLDYLERLGAQARVIPNPLRRCIEFGLPRPHRFGARQHRMYFPERDWETVTSGAAEVHTVPTRTAHRPESIAGFFAVARPRPQLPQRAA